MGEGCRLYEVASAVVLNEDSWILLTYSMTIERKQVVEYSVCEMRGGIVINATDADRCSASGKCSHFQKSPQSSLKISAGV